MNNTQIKAINTSFKKHSMDILNTILVKDNKCIRTDLEDTVIINNGELNNGLYKIAYNQLIPETIISPDDFPEIRMIDPVLTKSETYTVSIEYKHLKTIASNMSKNGKFDLTSDICLDFENNSLVYTDGHFLMMLPFSHMVPEEIYKDKSIIINADTLLKVMSALKHKRIVRIQFYSDKYGIKSLVLYFEYHGDEVVYHISCKDIKFPKYKNIIPTDPPKHILDFQNLKRSNLNKLNLNKNNTHNFGVLSHNDTMHFYWNNKDTNNNFFINTNIPLPSEFETIILNTRILLILIYNFKTKLNFVGETLHNEEFVFMLSNPGDDFKTPTPEELSSDQYTEIILEYK